MNKEPEAQKTKDLPKFAQLVYTQIKTNIDQICFINVFINAYFLLLDKFILFNKILEYSL